MNFKWDVNPPVQLENLFVCGEMVSEPQWSWIALISVLEPLQTRPFDPEKTEKTSGWKMHWLLHKRNRKVFFLNSKLWAWNPKKNKSRRKKTPKQRQSLEKEKKKCHHFRFVLGSLPCRKPLRILESQPPPTSPGPSQGAAKLCSKVKVSGWSKPQTNRGSWHCHAMGHGSWQIPHIGESVRGVLLWGVCCMIWFWWYLVTCEKWYEMNDSFQMTHQTLSVWRFQELLQTM